MKTILIYAGIKLAQAAGVLSLVWLFFEFTKLYITQSQMNWTPVVILGLSIILRYVMLYVAIIWYAGQEEIEEEF